MHQPFLIDFFALILASTVFAYCLLYTYVVGCCMAANSQSRGLASLGKRFVSHIRTSSAVHDPNLIFRKAIHASVYDKNIDDQVCPSLVPEEVLSQTQPEKYWVPHPKTGVFGPAHEKALGGSESAVHGSVLEEKTFFRPLENLEKPNP